MGWATFLLWGLFDIVIAVYAWFGLIETRGRTLEEISAPATGRAESGTDDSIIDDRVNGKAPHSHVR